MNDRDTILRPYCESDFESFASLVADPENMRSAGGVLDREDAGRLFQSFIEPDETGRICAYAIVSGDEYAGHCALKIADSGDAELIVVVDRGLRREGIGSTAVGRVREIGLNELGLTQIIATIDPDNFAAIGLCESCGFAFAGREEDDEGEYLVYSISASN